LVKHDEVFIKTRGGRVKSGEELSVKTYFFRFFCNHYRYEYKYFTEKGCRKTEKKKFLLKILRHFSTPAGTTTPITGKVCLYSKKTIGMP
jgi:hypothetical protein